jgi:hypothetical protein
LAAPGGDGVPGTESVVIEAGVRALQVPCSVPDCHENGAHCVIGLAHKPSLGYAYWVGT